MDNTMREYGKMIARKVKDIEHDEVVDMFREYAKGILDVLGD